MNNLLDRIMKDIMVEIAEEFDENFERKSFFGRPWKPVKVDPCKGSLLLRTTKLRSSIRKSIRGGNITFSSQVPYAKIHNEGGTIRQMVNITPKMRRFFWAKFRETREVKYQRMALSTKPISRTIHIPQRQFIGKHPRVSKIVKEIAEEHINKVLKNI